MMKKNNRHYGILALLICVFMAPGLAAYLLYMNPQWTTAATTNKGTLLSTPIRLSTLGQTNKWRMLMWSPTSCDQTCMQQVDQLARVRLAMGRRLYEVETVLILGDEAPPLTNAYQKMLSLQDILVKRLSQKASNLLNDYPHRQIFIANAKNELILVFDPSAKPADIFHDMKLLLTTTEK